MERTGHALLQRLASEAGVPAGVHLQIADRCNHACRHCYQVQGRKGEMTLAEIERILDDLQRAGIPIVDVSGGEATLRDDWLDVVRAARRRGFAVRLFTNGYTMTPAIAAELRAIGVLGVDVSVYSDDPAQHDFITRVAGSHARTLAGVRALLAAGVRVHLKVPTTSGVPDAGTRVKALAATLGPGVGVVISGDITPRETGEAASLAPSPADLVAHGVLEPWVPDDRAGDEQAAARTEKSCGACKDGVAILANGDLRPCTDIVAPLGNLRHARFLDLYAGSAASFVRELTWADVHGCRDCDLLAACHRCHASASHEAGDLLGPYASACASAIARYGAGAGGVRFDAPDAACASDRAPTHGPFRITEPGVLRAIPDRLTPDDHERRARFPWIQPTRAYLESMTRGDRRRLPILKAEAHE